MKNTVRKAFAAFFFGICVFPCLCFPFFKTESGRGEEAPDLPQLIKDNKINEDYSENFDRWFSYHLPFRNENISAAARIKSGVFSSGSEKVIVGKSGRLFYCEEISVYSGAEKMSEREISAASKYLMLLNEYCEERDIEFLFAAVPDKADVCADYLPDRIKKSEGSSDLEELHSLLQSGGVSFWNISEAFKENADKYYLKTDTHWNNLGGFFAWREIMNCLDTPYKTYDGAEYSFSEKITGDLADMLYPVNTPKESQVKIEAELNSDIRFVRPREADGSSDFDDILHSVMGKTEKYDLLIETKCPSAQGGNAVIKRDSFARAMIPYFIDNFKSTYITRAVTVNESELQGSDVFIYETAERNLKLITSETPYIPAPERDVPKESAKTYAELSLEIDTSYEMPYISGKINSAGTSENFGTEIIIVLSDEYAFEAYPKGEYGFGAYIPTEKIKSGEYDIRIFVDETYSDVLGRLLV